MTGDAGDARDEAERIVGEYTGPTSQPSPHPSAGWPDPSPLVAALTAAIEVDEAAFDGDGLEAAQWRLCEALSALRARCPHSPPLRCATCRWWEHDSDDNGFCGAIVTDLDSDKPRRNWYATPTDSADPDHWVRPWPMQGQFRLSTRADFGCVLWEPHDTEGTA